MIFHSSAYELSEILIREQKLMLVKP